MHLISEIDRIVAMGYSDREEFIKEAVRRYIEHLKTTRDNECSSGGEQVQENRGTLTRHASGLVKSGSSPLAP